MHISIQHVWQRCVQAIPFSGKCKSHWHIADVPYHNVMMECHVRFCSWSPLKTSTHLEEVVNLNLTPHLWVLKAVLCDQHKQAVQGQHANQTPTLNSMRQEVAQHDRSQHGWHDAALQRQQHLAQDVRWDGQLQKRQPRVTVARGKR